MHLYTLALHSTFAPPENQKLAKLKFALCAERAPFFEVRRRQRRRATETIKVLGVVLERKTSTAAGVGPKQIFPWHYLRKTNCGCCVWNSSKRSDGCVEAAAVQALVEAAPAAETLFINTGCFA
jgi:hypothetical protein